MIDKVAPMQTDLSVLVHPIVGGAPSPVQTIDTEQADLRFEEGSPIQIRLPQRLELRPVAAFSQVDIDRLPELSPPRTAPSATPYFQIGGGKDLELVLNVLLLHEQHTHLLRALVDTGAKVPLIVRSGTLQTTSPSPTPLQLVTADGTPMLGGTTGGTATLKVPVAVPCGGKLKTSALVFKDQWVYEANISGVDMIIGNPFLYAMKMVPIPSRRVMMLEEDVLTLQSYRRSGAPSTTTQRATVSPSSICTTHGPPELAGPENTPCGGSDEEDCVVPINYIDSDWARVQPWQPSVSPATPSTVSPVDMAHDDVPVGVNGIKSVAGGFREKRRRLLRGQGLLPPLQGPRLALEKNVEAKQVAAWRTETYTVLNGVRDAICDFAGFTPSVDAFAERGNARFNKFWDKEADAFRQTWGKHKLWMNPPFSMLPAVVDKILHDEASGIIIVPVWPKQAWFHTLSPVDVTWWDLPPDQPVFMSRGGITLPPRRTWRVRAVVFDALGTLSEDPWGWMTFTDNGQRVAHVGVRSVVDADHQAPGAEGFVKRLQEEFHDVLFDQVYAKDVDPKLRGPHGVASIKLKEGAVPKKEAPFRMLGVREEALKAKVEKSIANGWIVPCPATEWGARAFVVPKPANPPGGESGTITGGAENLAPVNLCGPWYPLFGVKPHDNPDERYWRLVIDYRYLNSQTVGDPSPYL